LLFGSTILEGPRIIAIVGSSGSGKSTIVGLIERFYDPQKGQVLLDGNNISNLDPSWLRQNIAVVSQEPILFGTSINENIRFGKPNATQVEIEHAAKLANAADFISKLPNGYNTIAGERGLQLSGGQKQRIAIARALLKNVKILILDEATSALDSESEAQVQEALQRLMSGKTVLVIAHRLSTIQKADLIVVLSDGKIKELGSHQQLIQSHGIYANLIANQTNLK